MIHKEKIRLIAETLEIIADDINDFEYPFYDKVITQITGISGLMTRSQISNVKINKDKRMEYVYRLLCVDYEKLEAVDEMVNLLKDIASITDKPTTDKKAYSEIDAKMIKEMSELYARGCMKLRQSIGLKATVRGDKYRKISRIAKEGLSRYYDDDYQYSDYMFSNSREMSTREMKFNDLMGKSSYDDGYGLTDYSYEEDPIMETQNDIVADKLDTLIGLMTQSLSNNFNPSPVQAEPSDSDTLLMGLLEKLESSPKGREVLAELGFGVTPDNVKSDEPVVGEPLTMEDYENMDPSIASRMMEIHGVKEEIPEVTSRARIHDDQNDEETFKPANIITDESKVAEIIDAMNEENLNPDKK